MKVGSLSQRVLTVSNLISISRLPLALLFLPQITWLRVTVLALAGLSDYLDGYIARRSGTASQLGAILDPLMDKIFVWMVLGTLIAEQHLHLWQGGAIVARDFFLAGFALFLTARRAWRGYQCAAAWWGKVATTAQYVALGLIVLGVVLPTYIYIGFTALGVLYFAELIVRFIKLG